MNIFGCDAGSYFFMIMQKSLWLRAYPRNILYPSPWKHGVSWCFYLDGHRCIYILLINLQLAMLPCRWMFWSCRTRTSTIRMFQNLAELGNPQQTLVSRLYFIWSQSIDLCLGSSQNPVICFIYIKPTFFSRTDQGGSLWRLRWWLIRRMGKFWWAPSPSVRCPRKTMGDSWFFQVHLHRTY